MTLSVVMICRNEEANLPRTLASVAPLLADGAELIVVDSGSTDRTVEVAQRYGANVYVEPWKGYARQKNSALDKARGDWILSLDADEALEPMLVEEIRAVQNDPAALPGYWMPRINLFMDRPMRHGVWGGDDQLRLFRRGAGRFGDRLVHESVSLDGPTGNLRGALIHRTCPDVSTLIDKFNRYSSLSAQMAVNRSPRGFGLFTIVVMPFVQFFKFYVLRRGFLDGREGFLLNLYYAFYISWKYAKAWEISRKNAVPKAAPHAAPQPTEAE
jgi:glycosyltransferase involved in cell wall biosynthesis